MNNFLLNILENNERCEFVEILLNEIPNLTLYITQPRKTKYGTMTFSKSQNAYKITINKNLLPEFFLYVFLHEYAHVLTHLHQGIYAKPHGKIWQQMFFLLLKKAIDKKLFSNNVSTVIRNQFLNSNVYSKKREFEIKEEIEKIHKTSENKYLKDLNIGDSFIINNQHKFIILKKLRTRYLCKNTHNGALYKISGYLKISNT